MSNISINSPIGINGIGRIGKLLVWLISARCEQEQIVISTGREVGKSLDDLAAYFSYDSTYGAMKIFCSAFKVKIKSK